MTRETYHSTNSCLKLLKSRFSIVVETVAAILMRILNITHKVIFNICKHSGSNFFSRIFFPLSFPILKAHTFLFKFVYLGRQRRSFTLGCHDFRLGINNGTVELDKCFLSLCRVVDIYKSFPNIKGSA